MFRLLLTLDVSKKLGVRRPSHRNCFFECSVAESLHVFFSISLVFNYLLRKLYLSIFTLTALFVMLRLSVSDPVESVESTHSNAESV